VTLPCRLIRAAYKSEIPNGEKMRIHSKILAGIILLLFVILVLVLMVPSKTYVVAMDGEGNLELTKRQWEELGELRKDHGKEAVYMIMEKYDLEFLPFDYVIQ